MACKLVVHDITYCEYDERTKQRSAHLRADGATNMHKQPVVVVHVRRRVVVRVTFGGREHDKRRLPVATWEKRPRARRLS